MFSDRVALKQILSVDIRLLADDDNEYTYSLRDFNNIKNSEIGISKDTDKWCNSSTIDLHIECNGYTIELTTTK